MKSIYKRTNEIFKADIKARMVACTCGWSAEGFDDHEPRCAIEDAWDRAKSRAEDEETT